MEKEFVPYELALKMKVLGFDEPCFYQYVRDFDNDGELIPIVSDNNYPTVRNNSQVSICSGGDCFAAPTYSQAFRWFREKYDIKPCFDWHPTEEYRYCIYYSKNTYFQVCDFLTYEEAELACLEKLIEFVEQNV
jgi:hypothetical protein